MAVGTFRKSLIKSSLIKPIVHTSFDAVTDEAYLREISGVLASLLSKCLGVPFGFGIDIEGLRGDCPVPIQFADQMIEISRDLHRRGQKLRFRVKPSANGFMVKDFVDLYKRIIDALHPQNAGTHVFKVGKSKRIDVTLKGERRRQIYSYPYTWNREHIGTELCHKSPGHT